MKVWIDILKARSRLFYESCTKYYYDNVRVLNGARDGTVIAHNVGVELS